MNTGWKSVRQVLRKIARRIPFLQHFVIRLKGAIAARNARLLSLGINAKPKLDTLEVLGHKVPSVEEWKLRRGVFQEESEGNKKTVSVATGENFRNIDAPKIAILISLFRSEEYLKSFLDNLRAQSIILNTEPCFILVEPSQLEQRLVNEFREKFPRSKIIIVPERITIYDAWNMGIRATSAPYLTNMNVDDLRRSDSLELQMDTLDDLEWVDIVYQDFYFTLEPHIPWDVVENLGFVTNLPPVTLIDLVWFGINCPHNAPMWRRKLHSEIGYFNSDLKSAGDYDFWIKCSAAQKVFYKLRDAHVAYFVNPSGMSTSSQSPSLNEAQAIQEEWKESFRTNFPHLQYQFELSKYPGVDENLLTVKLLQGFSGNEVESA
jgi:glycosyltransferase involved in cell wall biosynthesis